MNSLRGKRVLVTRPLPQALRLCELLEAEGARPISFPTVAIAPLERSARLDEALSALAAAAYHWVIFTSVNGVAVFWDRLAEKGLSAADLSAARLAAIGPATAQALKLRGVQVSWVPPEYVAERILDGLGQVSGQRILLPRAEAARPILAEMLTRQGAQVNEIPLYRALPAQTDAAGLNALRQGVDAITFTSSSTVQNFVSLVGPQTGRAMVACIGPVTADAARELTLPVHLVAAEYTIPGLIRALVRYYS